MNYTPPTSETKKKHRRGTFKLTRHLLFLVVLVTCISKSHGQVCCLTNKLNISTGIDPVTGLGLPGSCNFCPVAPDPKWGVAGVSPHLNVDVSFNTVGGIVSTGSANVIQPHGLWSLSPTTPASSSWISAINSAWYNSTVGAPSTMTLCRPFYLCTAATVTLNAVVCSDNFITAVTMSGSPSFFSQPDPGAWAMAPCANINHVINLGAGPNNVCITVQEDNLAVANQWMGLRLEGSLTASSNVIHREDQPTACNNYTVTCGPTINGNAKMCQGSASTYTGSPSGGTWTTSSPIASISLAAGVLTATGTGAVTITYTDMCNKQSTKIVNVIPAPGPITGPGGATGPFNVCKGNVLPLANPAAGGVWSSTNPLVASIDNITGVVMGNNTGSAIISYTLPGIPPCVVTTTVTVRPVPVLAPSVTPTCITSGDGFTLHAGATGSGTPFTCSWTGPGSFSPGSSVPNPIVTGIITPPFPASSFLYTYNLSVTNTYGCATNTVVPVGIYPYPVAGVLSADNGQPCSGTNVHLTATGYNFTGSWSVIDAAGTATYVDPVAPATSSTATLHCFNTTGSVITVTVRYTVVNPCGKIATRDLPVTILPEPVATPSASPACGYVCPGSATPITITGSPGSIVHYTTDIPSLAPGGTMTLTGTTTTFSSGPLTYTPAPTTYHFTITDVELNGCHSSTSLSSLIIEARFPQCNVVMDGDIPCMGANYKVRIYGDPGNYTVMGPNGVPFMGTISTPGGYFLSPEFTYPQYTDYGGCMGCGGQMVIVTQIVNPCGCTVTNGMSPWDLSLCSLIIPARPAPFFAVPTTPVNACTGQPVTLGPLTGGIWPSGTPITGYSWDPGPFLPSGAATPYVTITPTSTGLYSYTETSTGANGCTYTRHITMNVLPTPPPIVVPPLICHDAGPVVLTDAVPGGTWWSHPATDPIATINASTGVLTPGYSIGGTLPVNYIAPNGCVVSASVVITPNPHLPASAQLCQDATTPMPPFVGGTWWTSNPSVATITVPPTIVSGIAPGTALLSYTSPEGCSTGTSLITVNPLPDPITGEHTIHCAGGTTTLHCGTPGGTWNVHPGGGIVDPVTGDLTITAGPGAGSLSISYILPTDCKSISWVTLAPPNPYLPPPTACYTGEYVGGCYTYTFSGPPGYTIYYDCITTTSGGAVVSLSHVMPGTPGYATAPPVTDILPSSCTTALVHITGIGISDCYWPVTDCDMYVKPIRHDETTGASLLTETKFSVVPNPSTGVLTVSGAVAGTGEAFIEIVDILGKTIYTGQAEIAQGYISKSITLSNEVANGTYILRVKNSDVNAVVHFVLQR